MECDSQKPPLGTKVDRQIQHRTLYRSIHHPPQPPSFFFEHEDVILTKKCHGCWAIEPADNCSYFQSRIYHCWLRPDSFAVDKDHKQQAHKQRNYTVMSFRQTWYEHR